MSDTLQDAPPETTGGDSPSRRGLPPIAYPVLGLVFAAALVWSFSRILLAVSTLTLHVGGVTIKGKSAAAAIALLMALNVLVGAALVAYGRRVRSRPASMPLLVCGAVILVAGGVFAATVAPPRKALAGTVLALDAQNTKFVQTTLSAPPASPVTLNFDNKDAGTQHNFALFDGPDATSPVLFRGEIITGPATTKYTFAAPKKAGSYFFHCDVHPTVMTGTFVVGASGGGGSSAGGGTAQAAQVVAKNVRFIPARLTATPASGQVTIHFDNQDGGVTHNFVLFNGKDATAPMLFRGAPVTGPGAQDYTFAAPPAGSYFFHCEFHPAQMMGTLTIP